MITGQGQSFWWDYQCGSYCSTSHMGGLGQYITPAEIASASGVTLTLVETQQLQAEFDTRNAECVYTAACTMPRLMFIQRFTPTETKTILAAAKVSADVELYLWKMQQAVNVSLLDSDTIIGAYTLEAAGLIGPGRAAQILRAP